MCPFEPYGPSHTSCRLFCRQPLGQRPGKQPFQLVDPFRQDQFIPARFSLGGFERGNHGPGRPAIGHLQRTLGHCADRSFFPIKRPAHDVFVLNPYRLIPMREDHSNHVRNKPRLRIHRGAQENARVHRPLRPCGITDKCSRIRHRNVFRHTFQRGERDIGTDLSLYTSVSIFPERSERSLCRRNPCPIEFDLPRDLLQFRTDRYKQRDKGSQLLYINTKLPVDMNVRSISRMRSGLPGDNRRRL